MFLYKIYILAMLGMYFKNKRWGFNWKFQNYHFWKDWECNLKISEWGHLAYCSILQFPYSTVYLFVLVLQYVELEGLFHSIPVLWQQWPCAHFSPWFWSKQVNINHILLIGTNLQNNSTNIIFPSPPFQNPFLFWPLNF